MWFWATISAVALYLFWLALAIAWHWMFHPSLWFDWRWLLYGTIGMGFTVLPLNLLIQGIGKALDGISLAQAEYPQKKHPAFTFLAHGIGVAIIASSLSFQLAFWILSKLPIVSDADKPWWIL